MRNTLLLLLSFSLFGPGMLFGQTYAKFNGTQVTNFASASPKRYQLLYLPSDIENAPTTNVKAIYFRINGFPASTIITNFQVKLGCISATTFPGNGTTLFTNLTPVINKATYTTPTNGSEFYLPIEPAFTYQTGKTLVVEVSYSSGTPNLPVRYSSGPTAPNNKRLDASSSNPNIGNPSQVWLDFAFDPGFDEQPPVNDLCT
ncbi:MAG TPA: hypothetical protein PLK63_13155, partial [Catalimonadaceae bacterium]|nr:hypothetical protein [Catalimonadaceae bacterium]